ncbi:MAG: helix-turn-helix domain-containing protein [Prevotella sp.]|nr:helix-turn-helix domain-containing protein [Prevotella sp.]
MTPEERGKRIKEARISKKMTQSEVVGTFITRNMLSQIESGSATPSVKTLEYLASVLDIPISSLLPQGEADEDGALRADAELLVNAKTLYSEGRYREAVSALRSANRNSPLGDEMTAVRARCCLGLAKQLADENTPKAAEYAKEAAALAETGFYANNGVKNEALRLLGEIAEKLKKYYEDIISSI